jgi:hypothetical protein
LQKTGVVCRTRAYLVQLKYVVSAPSIEEVTVGEKIEKTYGVGAPSVHCALTGCIGSRSTHLSRTGVNSQLDADCTQATQQEVPGYLNILHLVCVLPNLGKSVLMRCSGRTRTYGFRILPPFLQVDSTHLQVRWVGTVEPT